MANMHTTKTWCHVYITHQGNKVQVRIIWPTNDKGELAGDTDGYRFSTPWVKCANNNNHYYGLIRDYVKRLKLKIAMRTRHHVSHS